MSGTTARIVRPGATAAQGAKADTAIQPGATTASGLTMASARILGRGAAGSGAIQELTIGSGLDLTGTVLSAPGGGGGGGATNLAYTPSATDGIVTSDTGTDATIPLSDGTNAGLLSPSQHASIAAAASHVASTANPHATTKAQVGLGNVDNTSDATKAAAGNAVGDAIAAKYTRPGTGIPGADLAAAVQTSLTKADTAVQPGSLSAVATSGAYADLTGRPTLGTAAAAATTDFATAAQGTDAREWTAATVTQVEAEAGTATTRRAWTAERVRQAILGWWNSYSTAAGRTLATAADAPAQRTALGLGTAATTAATAYATAAQGATADSAVQPGAITSRGLTMVTGRLLGRSTASTGAVEEIVVGSGLNLAGGTLTATGGGGGGATNLAYTASATDGTVTSDTGTDATIPLSDGTNAGLMSPAQHTKLAGVASGATANSSDAFLLNRANHTGTQSVASITGLGNSATLNTGTAAGTVAAGDDARFTDAREWTAATIAQAEAEAGTATTRRAWTSQRVRQAIDAWWLATSSAFGRSISGAASAASARSLLELGTAATTNATAYATAAQGAKADTAAQIAGDLGGTPASPTVPGLAGKQNTLVSGTNIKTINGTSVLGSGDISISGGSSFEVATFGNLPAASSVTPGRVYTVLGPICTGGARGTLWASDGTLWRPAGAQMLVQTITQVDGSSTGSTAEQILFSVQLPANLLTGVRVVRGRSTWISTASTDASNRQMRWRLGAAGTSADTSISGGVSGQHSVSGQFRMLTYPIAFIPISNTSIRLAGMPQYPATSLAVLSPDAQNNNQSAYNTPLDITVPSLADVNWMSASITQPGVPASQVSLLTASIYIE